MNRLCSGPYFDQTSPYHRYDENVKTCTICHKFTPNGYNKDPQCNCVYPEIDLVCLNCQQTSRFSHQAQIGKHLTFVGDRYANNPMYVDDKPLPRDATCINCGQAAKTWFSFHNVNFNRGGFLEPFCEKCVLEHKVNKIETASADLPELKARLSKLN